MKSPTTPLGFLPGDVEHGTHCMFIYNRKDDNFIQNVVDFLSAGVKTGELCVCAVHGPIREKITERMVHLGADITPQKGQVAILDPSEVYMSDGVMDTSGSVSFWRRKLAVARNRWKGIRVFGDVVSMLSNRANRLKLVEYEALLNLDFPANIAMCGYQSSNITRSLLLQAKSVHPFIANSRSIRKNPAFLHTSRFLSGFYRFRRVSKEYPVNCQVDTVQSDFEEIAARTPLTMVEIGGIKAAIEEVFTGICKRINFEMDSSHIHVTFAPEADKFIVIMWYHIPGTLTNGADLTGQYWLSQNDFRFVYQLMDNVNIERLNEDMAITMTKKYSAPWI